MLFYYIYCVSKFHLSWWNWSEGLGLLDEMKKVGVFLSMESNLGLSVLFLFNDTPAVAPVTEISQSFHCKASCLKLYYLSALMCI